MKRRTLYAAQAAYYIASGVWPLVSMKTFTAVTGPKTDLWLVKTVGMLAVANGIAIGVGALGEDDATIALRTLSTASALAFATVDIVYAARRTISPIYLADAVLELALVAALTSSS